MIEIPADIAVLWIGVVVMLLTALCLMLSRKLNQYQGGMCISGVLKTTERTARHLISPLGPKGMPTDSAV